MSTQEQQLQALIICPHLRSMTGDKHIGLFGHSEDHQPLKSSSQKLLLTTPLPSFVTALFLQIYAFLTLLYQD